MQNLRRLILRSLVLIVTLVVAAIIGAWVVLNNSLPTLDGEVLVTGLSSPVTIDRDDAGIPTITAGNRRDLAFATGFAHAQDRFFQMDLTLRTLNMWMARCFFVAALNVQPTCLHSGSAICSGELPPGHAGGT